MEKEKQQARERTSVDEKSAAELNVERAEIVSGISPAHYQQYEKVRKARKGIGIAEALDGRCSVCQIQMRPQFFQELRKGEQFMQCESCLRILYYNPPVKFEDLASEPASAGRK